jgi:hypothetical protein
MNSERRHFSRNDKVAALERNLLEGVTVDQQAPCRIASYSYPLLPLLCSKGSDCYQWKSFGGTLSRQSGKVTRDGFFKGYKQTSCDRKVTLPTPLKSWQSDFLAVATAASEGRSLTRKMSP